MIRLSHSHHLLRKRIRQITLQGKARRQAYRERRKTRRIQKQIRKARGRHHWYAHQQFLPLLRYLLPVLLLLPCLSPTALHAQILESIFTQQTHFDSIPLRSLRAEVDAVAFFHDNEYSSALRKGYSLPGVRLTPHLAYNPLRQVNLELGASMLIYNGANKYPCYAYHDIATWKGNQYQRGAHVLPWVRMQATFRHTDVVLGNIHGGSHHQLSAPLYNAEQNLSADPEMGIQILARRPHLQSDTWLNWQSYIFEQDSHQEAFTVGHSMRILWGRTDRRWQLYTPLQLTIQHRGGEQDTTALGVQTLSNASLGIAVEHHPHRPHINLLTAQLSALLSYQQAGHLWPFSTGCALHASAGISLLDHLHLSADYLHAPRQFATLFGNPFFGTISLRNPGQTYQGLHTLRLGLGYQYTFARDYTLGTHAELFTQQAHSRGPHPDLRETNFSFGLYFRVSPSILIRQL